ncbi:MAG: hypothetical protein Q8933_18110 [Bacteroidota bacterium]|nr:hypothetical protein [Bacteroidota bacterium]MDP4196591.1 hypothetical protein [Bacteroidota bacterium]
MLESDINRTFLDPDEELISIIGQNYLTSDMQARLNKSVLILSTKRLYQKGKSFSQGSGGSWVSKKETKICSIKDITGITYKEVNSPGWIVAAVILTLVFLVIPLKASSETAYFIACMLCLPSSILLVLIYFLDRKRLFVIHYVSGILASNALIYRNSELDQFQKAISLQKEKYIDELSSKVRQREVDDTLIPQTVYQAII